MTGLAFYSKGSLNPCWTEITAGRNLNTLEKVELFFKNYVILFFPNIKKEK